MAKRKASDADAPPAAARGADGAGDADDDARAAAGGPGAAAELPPRDEARDDGRAAIAPQGLPARVIPYVSVRHDPCLDLQARQSFKAPAYDAEAEVALLQRPGLSAELEGVWRHIGRALHVPADSDDATRQAALLRWSGFAWARDGALTAHPRGLFPSPLALQVLPPDVAAHALSLLPVPDRLRCACVSRAWYKLARLPAAWARVAWPYNDDEATAANRYCYRRGTPVSVCCSLRQIAFVLHGSHAAPLPGVLQLDCRERRHAMQQCWQSAVLQCPSLRVLHTGIRQDWRGAFRLHGHERGASPGELLELLRAAPALRLPDAHVELRPSA